MKLDFIPLDRLHVGKANMRDAKRPPDIADILPSVRARGVLVPILVRPDDTDASFEIVAGRRRYFAAQAVQAELAATGIDADGDAVAGAMLPCAIIEAGDDAAALEASLIENIARLDPDEVTQWESFTRLVKQGRNIADIATTFGLPELAIRRVLALGNLLPRIRKLYAVDKIDRTTVRQLTLASKCQQKNWLALYDSEDDYCPTGHQLKAWLFGGASIPVKHALFDLDSYTGQIVADLFGEGGYFADAEQFWAAQNMVIEARRAAYLDAGWSDVVIVPPSEHFSSWEYEKAAKRKGGRVYIDVRSSGEVTFHEGYVTGKEARSIARGETPTADMRPPRPEITSTMQSYVDLHRHAAVRADLLAFPSVALRLMVAHAIGGSHLWRVSADPRASRNDAVAESVETSPAEAAFDTQRRAVLGVLGFDPESPTVTGGNGDDHGVSGLFLRLLDLPDAVVMEIVAVVVGETLASGSAVIEALGLTIGTDRAKHWQADDAFFALIRDREVLSAITAEVAGELIAQANKAEKTQVLKTIIRNHLDGADGRTKVDGWVPRWMRFAPSAYTERGGVGTVRAHAKVVACRDQRESTAVAPDPDMDLPLAA
jgi:ParB family chromosome partitioning protein